MPEGAFVIKAVPPVVPDNSIIKAKKGQSADAMCNAETEAVTLRVHKAIVFCNDGLKEAPILGDDFPVKAGQEAPTTMSLVWLHELMHFYNEPSK